MLRLRCPRLRRPRLMLVLKCAVSLVWSDRLDFLLPSILVFDVGWIEKKKRR
jgi:hypothetical protein